jgi:hypothetical protein
MKKIFATLAIAALAVACGSSASGPIAGKWEFEKIEMNTPKVEENASAGNDSMGAMGDSLAAAMGSMASTMGNAAEEMAAALMKGTIYEFKGDGKCSMTIMGFPVDGQYNLTTDNKKLTMTQNGKTESFDVVKLDDKELDLKSTDGSVMHFLKK